MWITFCTLVQINKNNKKKNLKIFVHLAANSVEMEVEQGKTQALFLAVQMQNHLKAFFRTGFFFIDLTQVCVLTFTKNI